MWIQLTNAALSIVADPMDADRLIVRSRTQGDLERVFGMTATETPARDYPFRLVVPRAMVARVMAEAVQDIRYGNFKDAVKNQHRHRVYFRVYSELLNLTQARGRRRG